MVFFDYVVRNFSINYALSKRNYIIKKAKVTQKKSNIKILFCDYIKIIFFTILRSFTFQLIYYILYLIFILLGIFEHPFFYSFSLFELLNRVEVMLDVLKAIYVPGLYLFELDESLLLFIFSSIFKLN